MRVTLHHSLFLQAILRQTEHKASHLHLLLFLYSLLISISCPSFSLVFLLCDRLSVPASACRCWQKPMVPATSSKTNPAEHQLPRAVWSQVAQDLKYKDGRAVRQRWVSRGYSNSLSAEWISVEPQLESKVTLLWPLARNSPPQNLPQGVPRQSWVQATMKHSGKFQENLFSGF